MKINDFKKLVTTGEDGHDFFAPIYSGEVPHSNDDIFWFIRAGLGTMAEPDRGHKSTGHQLSAAKVLKRFLSDPEYQSAVIAWSIEDIEKTLIDKNQRN